MLHFERVPKNAKDYNMWQGTVLPANWVKGALNRATGGSPDLIIAQSAYDVLKDAGVKSLRCQPVRFD